MGGFKLNTDGISKDYGAKARGGGIIRDSNGCWVGGFVIHIGACDPVGAELWAFLQGISLAWSKGIHNLIVEVDSSLVADWMNKKSVCKSIHANLVSACLDLLQNWWDVKIKHVFREMNQVADSLANIVFAFAVRIHVLDEMPSDT
ncbi:nuclease, putative [Ricinus communis]|uniref:Nuclease, putative n=1 Tax=Ricinus communis TaxID=3988 RepID=B9RKW4_RICCO|nr:nuclease, putative [Ricinus communis]